VIKDDEAIFVRAGYSKGDFFITLKVHEQAWNQIREETGEVFKLNLQKTDNEHAPIPIEKPSNKAGSLAVWLFARCQEPMFWEFLGVEKAECSAKLKSLLEIDSRRDADKVEHKSKVQKLIAEYREWLKSQSK
jgi:hypothetical protein